MDVELTIGAYLREHPDVAAITPEVVGRTPSDTSTAWVRFTALDVRRFRGSKVDHAQHALCTFECYASVDGAAGQGEAWALGNAVRAALVQLDLQEATVPDFTVTTVQFGMFGRRPDLKFEPARERVILDATIYMHA